MLTSRVGPVLVGRLAGLAVAEAIHGQDPEGVVHVGGQAELRRGGGAVHLCHVGPNPRLVEQILILDQELWRKKEYNSRSRILYFMENCSFGIFSYSVWGCCVHLQGSR